MAGALLVGRDTHVFFAAPTEYAEVAEYYPQVPLKPMTRFTFIEIAQEIKDWGVETLGVESGLPHAQYQGLQDALPQVQITDDAELVDVLQRTKDADEIAIMRKASAINDAAMQQIQRYLEPGVTERQIAAEATYALHKEGADRISFLLVQFGSNSALPHAMPQNRMLREGDFILLDWGPVYRGYASDVTRTWVLGQPGARQREIHDLVRRAQMAALEAVQPGMKSREVDQVARDIITQGGYGEAFVHRLGHGMNVGPVLNPTSEEVLKVGDAFSIEPGVYLPGWGGVRIEDTVVLTETGGEAMDKLTKDLLVL
jgi:Xaa-Pro aminopeptidase